MDDKDLESPEEPESLVEGELMIETPELEKPELTVLDKVGLALMVGAALLLFSEILAAVITIAAIVFCVLLVYSVINTKKSY